MRAILIAAFILAACTAAQLNTPDGQLFCQIDAGTGGSVVVGLIEAVEGLAPGVSGLLIQATNAAKSVVDANCAAAAAIIPGAVGTAVPPPATPVGQIAITPAPGTPVAPITKGT